MDSLQHATHECLMDAWPEHSGWAKEAVALIRDRFLASTMTAMLELSCPVSFGGTILGREQPKRGRKRTLVSISTTSYKDVQRVQKERSTPDVADLGAQKWFSLQTCAIGQKEVASRKAQAEGSCFPAVTLLKEACKRQKEELGEARAVWEQRTGRRLGADGRDDELLSCLRLESRSKDCEQLPVNEPIDRLTLFEQALRLSFTLRLPAAASTSSRRKVVNETRPCWSIIAADTIRRCTKQQRERNEAAERAQPSKRRAARRPITRSKQ